MTQEQISEWDEDEVSDGAWRAAHKEFYEPEEASVPLKIMSSMEYINKLSFVLGQIRATDVMDMVFWKGKIISPTKPV